MVNAARRRATYEDVMRAPSNERAEILDGDLYSSPRPGAPHAAAAAGLVEELGPPFRRGRGGPGGWLLLFEPELHLDDDVLVPDYAGWRRERLPAHTDETSYFAIAPDWVCEVLSPSTAKIDRLKKMPIYARSGVGHVWLVDPLQHTLEVFKRGEGTWSLLGAWGDDAKVRAEPFEVFELDLAVLWTDGAA